ncbi:MAG: Lrp/AsnC family transcriptional regulator [Saprospiraceae bacterium]
MEIFSSRHQLDEIDKKILDLIQYDADYTNKEIASKLGLTITPVYERIKKMKKSGIIKKNIAILDPKKLGFGIFSFCNVSLKEHSKQHIINFENKIQLLNEVQCCYHISGQYDFLLTIYAKDIEEYQNFLTTKLAAIENISNVQSQFVMKEIKKEFGIKLLNRI